MVLSFRFGHAPTLVPSLPVNSGARAQNAPARRGRTLETGLTGLAPLPAWRAPGPKPVSAYIVFQP